MERNWIKIFSSANYYRSEMVKQALAGQHIESVIINKQDSTYHTFGEIEVYIHEEDFSNALEVLILNQVNL